MKRLKVSVTQEDIDKANAEVGHHWRALCCPLAQALKRTLGTDTVQVASTSAFVNGEAFGLSRRAMRFIRKYDRCGPAAPAAFVLTLA